MATPGSHFESPDDERISRINTHWSRLFEPRAEVCRYFGPAYRYFMGIVRNADVADELTSRFVERFLRGDFQKHANPEKGRFRAYLKISLRHIAHEYWRELRNRDAHCPISGPDGIAVQESESADAALDRSFDAACSSQWLHQAWKQLEAMQDGERVPYFAVLSLKTSNPNLRSQEIAAELAPTIGINLKAEQVRKILERAREKFAELLLEQVIQSLPGKEHDRIEAELIDLDLLKYCKSALLRRQGLPDGRSSP